MSAREQILQKLRPHTANAPAKLATPVASTLDRADLVSGLMVRARALQSSCEQIQNLDEAPQAIAAYLAGHGLPKELVMWPEFLSLNWAAHGITAHARASQANDLVGLTACFAAIAETGTLMLCSNAQTPAATSLLPETHIAIVPVSKIVATMEDAFQRMRDVLGKPPRAVNFVSGPSRTGDIEQTITLGAHGPYRMHLLIVANA